MPEVNQYIFNYKEVAEALIKQQGIREGLWGIYLEFGLAAANINTEEESKVLTPAAIITVRKIGLQRFTEETSLTVDAAKINPMQQTAKESTSKKRSG